MSRTRCALASLLFASALFGACSKAAPKAEHKLALTAALPTTYARDTKLVIGDTQGQKRLELTGDIGRLPFAAEWHAISGGPQTIEAFRAKALDGGSVGDTPPIHARFTGLDVKIIAVSARSKPAYRLAGAPGVKLGALADLRGKKIAYSPGQAQGAVVLRALRKAGIPQKEVTLVELNSAEFKDALSSKQVDVAPLWGPILVRYLREYRAEGAQVFDHGVEDSLAFFYVRTEVLEDPNKAAALREYVKLRTRAQVWAHEHPEAWIDGYYVKDQGLTQREGEELVAMLGAPEFPADWSEAIALTQETVDMIAQASGQKSFDAHELFDRRFERVGAEAALAGASALRE